jgi:hypothetical protein
MRRVASPNAAFLAAGLLALALGGCASSAGNDPADTLGNLLAFNSTKAPPVPPTKTTGPAYDIVCPVVDIKEEGAAHRVYSGRGTSNQDVRYQFSIGQTARECTSVNGQIGIKVGVEGKVLLGPAGSASSFNVPVSMSVRDEATQQIVASKTYQVAVTIPPGSPHATFSVVSELLVVPYRRKEANEDYIIIVGFEKAKAQSRKRRRISRRR